MGSGLLRGLVILAVLVAVAGAGFITGSQHPLGIGGGSSQGAATAPIIGTAVSGPRKIISVSSLKNDVSPPLRSITPIVPIARAKPLEHDNRQITIRGHTNKTDRVVQRTFIPARVATTGLIFVNKGFDGISQTGWSPPDVNGEIGPNNYVQAVNSAFEVFDRSGTSQYGPADINTVWASFGGACSSTNAGDPIVLYDHLADRWLLSDFTFSSPYYECIAISTTGDPTGTWYRYAFDLGTSLPDYPHLGVWPEGYYMAVTQFTGNSYDGPRPYVFDRTKMLLGQPATLQTTSSALGNGHNLILPANLDGSALPPDSSTDYFVEFGGNLKIYKYHVNFSSSASSSFTQSASLGVSGFHQLCQGTWDCIPQAGTSQKLEGLGDRLMHHLSYRNMGSYDTMVVNHSVDVGSGQAGIRWYEIRNPGSSPSIYQQGTYAPNSQSRWMGSAAIDRYGNIAIGYSVSSSSIDPSIRFAYRLRNDPLGTLPHVEGNIYSGIGYQSGGNRWGDYSSLTVDPVNDCTFWYTAEYNSSDGTGWRTRISSFQITGYRRTVLNVSVSLCSRLTSLPGHL